MKASEQKPRTINSAITTLLKTAALTTIILAAVGAVPSQAQTAGSTMGPWDSPSANLRFNDYWGAGGSLDRFQQRMLQQSMAGGTGAGGATGRPGRDVVMRPSAARAAHMQRLAVRGQEVIRQGNATTRVPLTSNPATLNLVARTLIRANAQQRSAWPSHIRRYEELAPYWGYDTNDVADGAAVCATSLYRLWMSDAASVEIGQAQGRQLIAALRARFRTRLLNNPMFQGMSADEKQAVHQYFAILTFAMPAEYERARQRGSDHGYITNVAMRFFRDITGLNPNSIRFDRSGVRLD